MAYGRDDEHLHGTVANHLLNTRDGQEIGVTVSHLDGLVMARTPFHNSMNYRSAVVRGRARRIDDEKRKQEALKLVTDPMVANWDDSRLPSRSDLRKTLVAGVAAGGGVGQSPQRRSRRRCRRHGRSVVGRRSTHRHPPRAAGHLR